MIDIGELLMSHECSQHPYPVYGRLRDAGPVVWSDALNSWLVGGHDEVRSVLADHDAYSSTGIKGLNVLGLPDDVRAQVPLVEKIGLTPALVFSDPPVHTRHRKLVNRPMTPRALIPKREWMTEHCRRLVDAMATKERPDLINDLALPLSIGVVVELFGASLDDIPLYLELSAAQREFFAAYRPEPAVALATEEVERRFHAHLSTYVAQKRQQPDDSLLSALIAPDVDGQVIDEDEIFLVCHVFLTAAFETTAAAMASMMYGLLSHPDQLGALYENRELIPSAFEEAVRWESPIQRLVRIAAVDTELAGQPIRKGDALSLYLAAANRDPRLFEAPDRFELDRERRRQIPFGYGIHFCVGAGLGRLEGACATNALLDRFATMRVADDWAPVWTRYPQSRMLATLPIATT
jgi:cytochrome P450